ncbi:TetR/AcrR family transcriptional regulator [Pseudonocardia spinosispora]|uniref:TetR/AcrR family transcriptional regulator n=1 Tax=Pseudonocardia spinosispora TaxID=103441 RepID=UPI0004117F93|nr:TetR/AcrR family transcriptional regulator [Pseudonocardia spinosispora]
MAATTRREQRDRTRTHLLETTVDCLVELGYAGTSTQRIQERAGVSRGALLHHFPSKAELLAAAVEYVARLQLDEIRAAAPDTAQGRLAAVRAAMSGPAFQAALELWMASRTDPALREALLPSQREIGHAVQSLLAPDFASQSPAEARVSLESLLMLLRGLALTSTLRDDPELADAVLARWSSAQ